jgi:pimeloyl-ACP methyl ester carboxylesterase
MVHAQFLLLDHLEIDKVHACVGASLGGMLSLASAAMYSHRVGKFVSISACAKSFPGSIAFRHAQRQSVMSDPNWNGGDYYDSELPAAGLRLARQIGTITYRSGQEWQQRFSQKRKEAEERTSMSNELQIEHYLAHQGMKWVGNYDPNSMLWISKAMDNFSIEAPDQNGQPSLVAGLAKVMQPALVIGVQHDVLFPSWQQKQIADTLKAAGNKRVTYYELDSVFGHDAFLLESHSIGPAVKGLLEQEPLGARHLWEEMAANTSRLLALVLKRSSSSDSMRDIFRSLGGSNDSDSRVDTERLKNVMKLVLQGRVPEHKVDAIFVEKLPGADVSMKEFLSIRTSLQNSENDVYLP